MHDSWMDIVGYCDVFVCVLYINTELSFSWSERWPRPSKNQEFTRTGVKIFFSL